MKKKKDIVKRTIVVLSTGSLLFSSCSDNREDLLNSDVDFKFNKQFFAKDFSRVNSPFSLRSKFSDDEFAEISSFARLSTDLYNDTSLADKLKNNFSETMSLYNLSTETHEYDSPEIQFLLLLADPIAKEYLETENFVELAEYAKKKGINLPPSGEEWNIGHKALCKPGIAAIPVAIYVAAATILAVEVSVVVHFAVKFWFAGVGKKPKPSNQSTSISATCENVSESLMSFDLIDDDTKQAVSEYLEGVISESIQGR